MWSLFRRNSTQPTKISIDETIGRFIRVDALDFFGQYSMSPDGRYLVAWSDSDQSTSRCGFRDYGHGSFLLAHDGVVVARGVAERPNDGNVSNTGAFVINDWLLGDGLKGTFLAYAPDGSNILRFRFEANLLNNGISDDGEFAVCQLCNSPNDDGGVLAFFDLSNGHLLWKRVPDTGWASRYTFRVADRRLALHYAERGAFEYDFSGAFLDQARWDAAAIDFASGYALHSMAKSKLNLVREGKADQHALGDALTLSRLALTRGLEQTPKELAAVHRTIGEIHEHLGNRQDALAEYEIAISLNPNVGLKRKVASLRADDA